MVLKFKEFEGMSVGEFINLLKSHGIRITKKFWGNVLYHRHFKALVGRLI